ncbi:RelA/SpoT family protein [Prevotella sp. P4-67]|uniref:RelA/SpoT family protein n=1 Tax=Prevotella sp. P4-67 TaxID=2024227 RepID=UPI000B9793A8|nr:HD domain-containing protein [Prevotella sp. P4-67]OYP76302.1 RelA/SpoT family protein [Prevotella sp. P4-67]
MNEKYEKKIQTDVDAIFTLMAQRVDEKQMNLLHEAYNFAAYAHKDQLRKSGEPYISHPVAVARIVAEELELGANPVMAAFQHDVVEDCPYSIDEIRERFGDDVAFLVGVVTKQKKAQYDQSKQVDNFRQMLSSVQFDVRAILVKLADRLHNMRTLSSMRPDKQMKIASETDYFYAPLANRLGLYNVKTELENLSFRYRCPREYEQIEKQLAELQLSEKPDVDVFIAKTKEILEANGIDARIELRMRSPYSIWRKMQSKCCDFEHIDSKHYLRIIYKADGLQEEKKQSLHIYAVLSDCFKERPCSVVNYINAPKENGYQSFHVKFLNPKGQWEEVHISSERMIRNNRLGCTAERTEENLKAWLEKFRAVLKDIAYHTNEMDYMDGVTASFYHDNIMAFTPKGKCIVLPKYATALDFAFEIHTEVGLHAVYARINGKLSSVKTMLHRGDCVEIGTAEDAVPEAEWQNHVLTYKAKRSLGCFFTDRPKMEYKRCSCCHPLPGDEVVGFKNTEGQITLHKRNCLTAIRQASKQGDTIVAVDFKENEQFLFPVRVCIRGIDRHHLLSDVVACITEQQNLSISELHTVTQDRIVETTADFEVHSSNELKQAIENIRKIKNVDEVARIDIE